MDIKRTEGNERVFKKQAFNSDLMQSLREHYASQEHLPYHSWKHIEDLLERASNLSAACFRAGHALDTEVLYQAILFHDVLYHLDHTALGYNSKEELSAEYAYHYLTRRGIDETQAAAVKNIILSTHSQASPNEIEEVIIRAADMGGLSAEYRNFRDESEKLWREARAFGNPGLSWADFARGAIQHLAHYLCPVLELTEAAKTERGTSAWHERALQNILRLYRESQDKSAKVALKLSNGPETASLDTNTLYVSAAMSEAERRFALNAFESSDTPSGTALLAVPLEHGLLPLGDNSVDSARLPFSKIASIEEVLRVLRAGSTLSISIQSQQQEKLLEAIAELYPLKMVSQQGLHFAFTYS